MKLRCVTHDRVFSESVDRNFHEGLNVGCRWEEVKESGGSRGKLWVAITVGIIWATLIVVLSWVLH